MGRFLETTFAAAVGLAGGLLTTLAPLAAPAQTRSAGQCRLYQKTIGGVRFHPLPEGDGASVGFRRYVDNATIEFQE